jgi:iron-regulated transporter 1
MNSDIKRLMLGLVTVCGCGLKLATVGMNVCVERDWVMAIAAGAIPAGIQLPPTPALPDHDIGSDSQNDRTDRTLLRLNTTLRRIDLICKLVAPLFVSLLTSTIGYRLSAAVLLGMGVVAAAFEAIFVGVVYAKFPVLALPRPRVELMRGIEEDSVRIELGDVVVGGRKWIIQQAKDWNEFIRHPIFLSERYI